MGKIMKLTDLNEDARELCLASLEVRKKAYAPYSKFRVGAALKTKAGKLVDGCNVENASYGLSICAERSACVRAVSQGFTDFVSIAIAADLNGSEFVGPCGACRQFLAEFHPEMPIYLVRVQDLQVQVTTLGVLLPESFSPKRSAFPFHNGGNATTENGKVNGMENGKLNGQC